MSKWDCSCGATGEGTMELLRHHEIAKHEPGGR